jgi:hypothetical protein
MQDLTPFSDPVLQNEQFQTIRKPQIILELEHLTIR